MKKKTLLALIAVATLSLAACGKTEETANTNVNEPVVESTVQESQVAESTETATQESHTTESTEASSEAPATEMTYEVSAVALPDGTTPEPVDTSLWLERMGNDTSIAYPYYTVTNTSNLAYSIELNSGSMQYRDNNFEAGESVILPALPNSNDDGTFFEWLNINEFVELGMTSVNTGDVNSIANTGNRVQEKTTITFDASKVNTGGYSQLDNIDFTVPGNNFSNNYIIFYDEAGNVIATWATGFNGNYGIVTNGTDATNFIYPMFSDCSTQEPFTWASADVYYSYEVAQ